MSFSTTFIKSSFKRMYTSYTHNIVIIIHVSKGENQTSTFKHTRVNLKSTRHNMLILNRIKIWIITEIIIISL